MSQYHINDNANCFNTNLFNNVWNSYTIAEDRSQLLAWLSPLEPKLRHRDIQERRLDNVGEWLMGTEEFRSWNGWSGKGEDDKAVLFWYGGPGVGGTFIRYQGLFLGREGRKKVTANKHDISSLVVDRLCDQARGKSTIVTCFYFDFAARKEQSAASVLGSLLKQIVGGMETIPEEISRAFQEQKRAIGGRGPQLLHIVKMLQPITSSLPTFICVDALDECAVAHRVKVFNSLKQILEKSPGTRIFITGRPHIQAEIEKRLAGRVASVSIGPSRGDIIEYLRVRLEEDETPDAMDESLEAEILEKIPENMSEMYVGAMVENPAIHSPLIDMHLGFY